MINPQKLLWCVRLISPLSIKIYAAIISKQNSQVSSVYSLNVSVNLTETFEKLSDMRFLSDGQRFNQQGHAYAIATHRIP